VSHACNTVTERRLRFFGHITHSAPDEDHHCALTLLVERQEEHLACKNWVMRCWCGYLSGARCRLFAYGPPDATAIPKPHHLLPHSNPYSFLPFRYWLTQFVLEKRLLNWCSSSSSSSSSRCKMYTPCWSRNAEVVVSPAVLKALHEYSPSSSGRMLKIRSDVDPLYWSYVDSYLHTDNAGRWEDIYRYIGVSTHCIGSTSTHTCTQTMQVNERTYTGIQVYTGRTLTQTCTQTMQVDERTYTAIQVYTGRTATHTCTQTMQADERTYTGV